MSDRTVPNIPKWPFFVADVLLLGAAVWVARTAPVDAHLPVYGIVTGCTIIAACLVALPFVLEHRAATALSAMNTIQDATAKIQAIEAIANQISSATSQWQGVQEHSVKTVESARQIAEQFSSEARTFSEFLKTSNDAEKARLRLEVEKLHRGEGEWLQILVRIMDHTYALYNAGVRSGQQNVIAQLAQYNNACRDTIRRIGLMPFVIEPGKPFDAETQENAEGDGAPPDGACVVETVATGYTFQGQLIRKAIVVCRVPAAAETAAAT